MFREFFRFELSYWLRGWMLYIFVVAIAVMFGLAAGSDNVQIGSAVGNAYKNGPYTIALWYAASGILTCFMAAAIYDSSASRDFSSKMSDLLFSKPLSKWGYLLGRFTGATLIALVPSIGISIGVIVAGWFNLSDTERWGPTYFWHHWQPFLIFVVPNTLLFGAIVFAVASATRSTLYSFLSLLLLLVVYAITQSIAGELDYETFACLSDPFGAAPYGVATKYWTVAERNTLPIPLTPLMLGNRLLWIGVALAIFGIAGRQFSFEVRAKGKRRAASLPAEVDLELTTLQPTLAIPKRDPSLSWWTQFRSALGSDMRAVVGSATFVVILCFSLFNTGSSLFLSDTSFYGSPSFPVTYKMIDQITGSLIIFPLAIITFFTGVLVWRDRDSRIHEITGATPAPNSVFVVSRFVTMAMLLYAILIGGIALGCFYQWLHGYHRFQLGVYASELLGITGSRLLFLTVAGFVAHTLAPNKYAGYAMFILFLVLNAQLWGWLRWETLLVRFGAMPSHVYSDLFGIAPYFPGLLGFGLYWGSVSVVLLWLCTILMPRGAIQGWIHRMRQGFAGVRSRDLGLPALALASAGGLAGWLGYNTMILNRLLGSEEIETRQVEYEKKYESLKSTTQPRIQSIEYAIDIFPETRNVVMKATQTIANKSDRPIDTLYLNVAPIYETTIEIDGASLVTDDERLSMRTYKLSTPMQPGETLGMHYEVKSTTRGIENQVSNAELVQNGTFFNNSIAPSFGFSTGRLLSDPRRRKAKGLDELQRIPRSQPHRTIAEIYFVDLLPALIGECP
ncbi:MAG: ABC transporter permease [Pirellula sp.]|nr:ABC transporter permease [Pirellula sp.]